MAVTGAIFKALTFNGESSRTYGVYITGQAVYNAPNRDVEMVTIPGRSGAFPLDHGRFENIEVTYPAGTFADNEEDFAAAISDFRNALCAAKGYCRLEDEYNPNEYRLAIYKSGLEVEPTAMKAGEFDITFECKPQRYLKTGEDPVTIGASTALTNPTRFESSPEIRVKGYGTVAFNGYEIALNNVAYGDVILAEDKNEPSGVFNLGSDVYANNGDPLTIVVNPAAIIRAPSAPITYADNESASSNGTHKFVIESNITAKISFNGSTFSFTKGTSGSDSIYAQYDVHYVNKTSTVRVTFTITYNASADTIAITTALTSSPYTFTLRGTEYILASARVDSSKSVLGNPTIIDCENGEAYKVDGGKVVPLNRYVDLGTDLPKFATGQNPITTTGSITECVIIPRWWKI